MATLVRKEYTSPHVRTAALSIVQECGTIEACQASQIRMWLGSYCQFIRDPSAIELVQSPVDQVRIIEKHGRVLGDCDDVAVLGAALGMAVGLKARLIANGREGRFEHVFAALGSGRAGRWFDLDITRASQEVPAELRVNEMTVDI